jgi:hypothetical protein
LTQVGSGLHLSSLIGERRVKDMVHVFAAVEEGREVIPGNGADELPGILHTINACMSVQSLCLHYCGLAVSLTIISYAFLSNVKIHSFTTFFFLLRQGLCSLGWLQTFHLPASAS